VVEEREKEEARAAVSTSSLSRWVPPSLRAPFASLTHLSHHPTHTGRPLGNLTLVTLDGRTLHGGGSEVEAGGAVAVAGPATTAAPPLPAPSSSSFRPAIAPPPPPPLTPLSPTITLIIHPRTQTETWSAYWKESMRTLTKACAPFTLAAGRGDAVAGVLAQVGLAAGWPGVEGLER
jgi:hypothetical protein